MSNQQLFSPPHESPPRAGKRLLRHLSKFVKRSGIPVMLFIGAIIGTNNVYAQAPTITYPTAAQDLTRAYGQSNLTVKVVFNGACTGATTVRIALPASVNYVAGTVAKTAGTATLSITESSIADLSNPVFSISGTIAIGNEITFTLARKAGCGSLATAKDSVYVITSGGCSNASELVATENTYNILSPSLSIIPPPALTNATIGTTATRTTTITNGGNGVLDTLRFYAVYPGSGIINTAGNVITANGASFAPSSTNGDTLFYKIYGAAIFGGNNLLSNGETVTITEPVKVVKCNTTTAYGTGWGKTQAVQCQTATATSTVTMATGVPNSSITISEPTALAACTPSTVTVTLTNSGNGGAAGAMYNVTAIIGSMSPNNVATIFVGTGPDNSTASISFDNFKINGNPVTTTQSGTAPFNIDAGQFTSDPDGAGSGLEDLDGDGQFDDLAPGKSLVITCRRTYNIWPVCTTPSYYQIVGAQIVYNNMCGTAVSSLAGGGGATVQSLTSNVINTTPVQVAGGSPFTFRVCKTGFASSSLVRPTDSLYLELTLPAGLSYVGSAQLNGLPATVTTSGSTLYISGKAGTASNFCFNADMVYACGTSGNISIPYKLYHVLDRSCNAIEYFKCSNLTINAKCPAPCPGLANLAPVARRVNYGFADAQMTTPVNPATLSGYSVKTGMPYDTFNIVAPAKEWGTYSNLYYYYQVDKAGGTDVLQFVSGTVNYLPNGASTPVSCAMPAPDLSASTATLTKFNWNFTPMLTAGTCGLPSSLSPGDSIWVDMKYAVTTANNSLLYGGTLTSPPNGSSYFYNLNASNAPVFCDAWAPDIYLVGLNKTAAGNGSSNPAVLSGCSPANTSMMNYSLMNNEGSDIFPGEFRPTIMLDSVVITLPQGISWTGTNATMYIDTFGTAGTTNRLQTTQSIPGIANGNQIVLVNPGDWRMSDLTPNNYVNRNGISFAIMATCEAAANSKITVTSYGKSYVYAGVNTPFESTYTTGGGNLGVNFNTATKPALTVQNNTGMVQGVQPQHYWDVQVNSTGTTTAPNLWMALEKPAGSGIAIDSVVLKPSNTVLTPLTYGTGDKWYKVSTAGLNSGAIQQARVYFKYTNCSPDSITFKAGWNCSGYPSADPGAYACTAAQTYLKVEPQPSQVQLSVARQPGGGSSIDLCTTDSAILIVNSAQAANLVNPYVTFYPPAGVSPAATILVEYPLGSGNYQPATVTGIAGGGYKIDLTAHTAIGTSGILGTVLNPGTAERQAKIKLDFTTACGFSSGTPFVFNAYGNMPCGTVAIGNGIAATTTPLNITGVTTVGGAGISIGFGTATSTSCGTAIPVSLTTTPTGVATSVGDTMVYTLPIGLAYAGGLTAGFSADTSGTGGATSVKVAMPVGTAPGTPINYSFNVIPQGRGCGSVNITGAYKRSIAPLMCGGTPCSNSSVIIANGTSPDITLNKPDLSLNDVSYVSGSYTPGGVVTMAVTVENSGSVTAGAGAYEIEAFCGTSSSPFSIGSFPVAVAAAGSETANMSFTIPATGCVAGNLVTYKIRPVTELGVAQCLCDETSFSLSTPLPVTLLSFNAGQQDCNLNLITWEVTDAVNFDHFELEVSKDGHDYDLISTLRYLSGQPIYSYTHNVSGAGVYYYRLKMVDIDQRHSYSRIATARGCNSNTVVLYPNPTSSHVSISGLTGKETISVYGINGQLLIKKHVQASEEILDISHYASGTYTVTVMSGKEIVLSTKVVKK